MAERPRAVAFDVDGESLTALREAFPDWDIKATDGATVGSLARDWTPRPELEIDGEAMASQRFAFSPSPSQSRIAAPCRERLCSDKTPRTCA